MARPEPERTDSSEVGGGQGHEFSIQGAETLHQRVEVLREDITRIAGPLDLRARVEELQVLLSCSERRRRNQHELIVQLQENHRQGMALLRQGTAEGSIKRDQAHQEARDELDGDKQQLSRVKSKLIGADVAAARKKKEVVAFADEIRLMEQETVVAKDKSAIVVAAASKLQEDGCKLQAEAATLKRETAQATVQLSEFAVAEVEATGPPLRDLTPLLSQMKNHLTRLENMVATKDEEISGLRLVVQQECIARTQLLRAMKGSRK